MKNLLITGGTGFFGRALLRYIDKTKRSSGSLPFDTVTVLSRSPSKFSHLYPDLANFPWLKFHAGDVLMPKTLPFGQVYHSIIHAATDSVSLNGVTQIEVFNQVMRGTENLLQLAVSCNSTRFLFTSSGAVYGPQPSGMPAIPESYNGIPEPTNPNNAYGVAKRQAEHLCALYAHHYGIETVIARCFCFVGQDLERNAHFAIGNFIRDALERPQITVNGNGAPVRSYLHQYDLARWLITLLQFGASGQAYNVGSDEEVSIVHLANLIKSTLAPHKQVILGNNSFADNLQRIRYIPDISKAQTDLGLKVTILLTDAIRQSALSILA